MTQPTTLHLADALDTFHNPHDKQAAAELRRLADIERRFYELQRHGVSRAVYEKVEAQRDAMQERAEYWKRKHDDEETGAERYALRVQRDELLEALRVFVSCALPVSTEIDERGHRWTEAYLDQALPIARAAIAKREQNDKPQGKLLPWKGLTEEEHTYYKACGFVGVKAVEEKLRARNSTLACHQGEEGK